MRKPRAGVGRGQPAGAARPRAIVGPGRDGRACRAPPRARAPRGGGGAPGAGTGPAPTRLGPATNVDPRGSDTFELAINAPVRAGRGGPRRPSGEAPAADRDTQPQLGRSTRGEQTMHRMPVPAAYE